MSDELKVKIITPREILCDIYCSAVTIPAELGEIQVCYGHMPLVSRLIKGKIVIYQTSIEPVEYDVEDGLFQVTADEVDILLDELSNNRAHDEK